MIWAVIILACHEQFMSAKIWIKNDFTIIFRLDKNRIVWYNNLRLGCVAKTIEYYQGVAAGSTREQKTLREKQNDIIEVWRNW